MNTAVLDKEKVGQEEVQNSEQDSLRFERYMGMSDAELHERIERARKTLGSRVVVLGHHYQRDDVIRHADLTGDWYQLSVMAAERKDAEFIVLCGVHCMGESADILAQDN